METNESILTKSVVSIEDRKLMGKIKDVVIDCNTRCVSHYIVASASTNTSLVLPLSNTLSVGDTFMTIQSRGDFLSTTDLAARGALDDNFDLAGVEVYSHSGSKLGVVESFDIDTVFGKVTKIELKDGNSFDFDSLVFFAPEFIFVNDGTTLDIELREKGEDAVEETEAGDDDDEAESESAVEVAEEVIAVDDEALEEVVEEAEEIVEEEIIDDEVAEEEVAAVEEAIEEEVADEVVEEAELVEVAEETEEAIEVEAAEEADASEGEDAASGEENYDDEFKAFLLGKTLNERVVSKEGDFVIEAGVELTDELIEEARKYDAMLLLMMSVDS